MIRNHILVNNASELIELRKNEPSYYARRTRVWEPRRIFPDGEYHTEKMNIRELPDDEDV